MTDCTRIHLINGAFVRVSEEVEQVIDTLKGGVRDDGWSWFQDPGHGGEIVVRVDQVTHVTAEDVA